MVRMEKGINTFEEFNKTYYPRRYEEERINQMTPKELGGYLAQKTLSKITKILHDDLA